MSLHLNLAQIGLHLDTQRLSTSHFLSSRVAIKKGLDINVVQNCLDSLDVFRDLLEGIPQQRNRVVRDVCKNIDVKHYQQGDVIYDVGQKAKAVYFCLSGEVSICIVKEVPKDPNQKSDQRPQQNSSRNYDKLNNPKTLQNLSSMTISVTSTSMSQQQQIQKVDHEIDVIQMGQGFGQAQFISSTTRTVKAAAKLSDTVIGKLELNQFAQVLENYKQRVYYKKRDMFQKCPLFANLPLNKLEFIINNTKPMTINISYQLVKEGSNVDTVYLVNKGQVSIWKTGIESNNDDMEDEEEILGSKSTIIKSKSNDIQKKSSLGQIEVELANGKTQQEADPQEAVKQSYSQVYSSLMKLKEAKHPIPLEKNHKVFMGLLSQGSFLGDMELAMGTPFRFNAVCRTQRAEVYYCDRRIILSQISQENIEEACKCYKAKETYINEKIHRYKCAKQKIQRQKQIDLLPPLTKAQIHLKRKLMHRHVQEKPTLIGHCSPRDIQKMIMRKEKRVIKQPEVSKFPILELFPNHSVKKRSLSPTAPTSFNPLSIVQMQGKKCITQFDEYDKKSQDQNNPELKRSEEFKKFKSMLIQIKPTKISLRDVKYGAQQQNMAVVGKILGRYRRCQSRLKSLSEVIDKIEKSRK